MRHATLRGEGPHLTPAGLAAAMLQGLESRKTFRPPPAVPDLPAPRLGVDYYSSLMPVSSLDGFPVPRKSGALGYALRLARRVVKKMMAPWLHHQARFNHAVINAVSADQQHRHSEMETVIEQLNLVRRDHGKLLDSVVRRGLDTEAPAKPATHPGVKLAALGEMFLLTRLPAPPGRVLVLHEGTAGLQLTNLGYSVVCNQSSSTGSISDQYPRESIDVIVALDGVMPAWENWLRVLVSGGRVIGSSPEACPKISGFQTLENVTAIAYEDGWRIAMEPAAGAATALWVAVKL